MSSGLLIQNLKLFDSTFQMFDQLITFPQSIQDKMIDTNTHTHTHPSRTRCELVIPALKQSEPAHFLDHAGVCTFILLK